MSLKPCRRKNGREELWSILGIRRVLMTLLALSATPGSKSPPSASGDSVTPRVHWHIDADILCRGSHRKLSAWQRAKALYQDLASKIPLTKCDHCNQVVEVAGTKLDEVSCHETVVKCDLCGRPAEGPGNPAKFHKGWRKILRGSAYRQQWGGRWACSQDCRDLIR